MATTAGSPLLSHAPRFDVNGATKLARDLYGLTADATPLPSERDQNFLLQTTAGERFVLKVSNAREDREFLDAQRQAMSLAADHTGLCAPVVPLASGDWLGQATGESGTRHFVRLVPWIDGIPSGDVQRHTPAYRRDLGRAVARVDAALREFDHPAAHRDLYWDLARGIATSREHLAIVGDGGTREAIGRFLGTFERDVAPMLARLPQTVIHNDANDYNVLVRADGSLYERHQRVAGLIDFGDMVHTHTVNGLAIAAAYATLGARDPLAALADVAAGYHAARPLEDDELAVLFGLVCLRLCTSVCVAAHQTRQRPEDPYLAVSQAPIARTLPLLLRIPAAFAEAALRYACGMTPVPGARAVEKFLASKAASVAPILGDRVHADRVCPIALDVGSPLLSGTPAENDEPRLTARVFARMKELGATVGVGGYGEARLIYATPAFADPAAAPGERRTVHLGIDLFAAAGAPVHAPLAGKVVAARDNAALQDYGPVIVLEHATDKGRAFYTLYGHLSRESLDRMTPGRAVAAGDKIATLGTPDVNGGWTPHLHFQVMTDLLGLGHDFPGVARPAEREVWLSFCPDPSPLMGVAAQAHPPRSPDTSATLATRRARLGGNLSVAYREPVKVVRGAMQYLYDADGRRYVDAYNNVPHVGHSHPRVVRAAAEQMAVLNTNTRYLHDAVNRLAEEICATLPEPLGVCWFVNSGSEANELAIRLARAHTGAHDMVVLDAAYHGVTTTLIDLSPYKHDGPGGDGAPPWVHVVPVADTYRGQYRSDDARAGEKYAGHVGDVVGRLAKRDVRLAAFIAESCPSVGGQIMFPAGYLQAVYAHVRAAGGVCIADEVQTGYGRLGTHFWGFEQQGVVPDIVVLGKPIGNGHPLGAVVTTPAIARSFDNGMEFFSTFGGNTVSAVVGLEVLGVVRDERLQRHARDVGDRMLAGLRALADRFPLIGDVRGSGLFLGVELVRDRQTLDPAGDEASFVANRMREEGILLGTDGPHHNVVKIRPPMPFTADDADMLVETFARILQELSS